MSLPETELNLIIFSALPHSPTVPFVWIYSVITLIAVLLNPWICRRAILRVSLGLISASAVFIVCHHFVDKESEYNARMLSKILATGKYRLWSVDEGEWIEIQQVDSSDKIHLGISHAEAVNRVLEKKDIPFLSLVKQ
jgi:hypothetical protein